MSNNTVDTYPENAVLSTGTAADKTALKWTADVDGADGEAITVAYVESGSSTALSIAVAAKAITVNLATTAGDVAKSTAAEVLAAVEAKSAAMALVSIALDPVTDGSGTVAPMAATALAARTSHVHTNTVITDPNDAKAVQIPPAADRSGDDTLSVHSESDPTTTIANY